MSKKPEKSSHVKAVIFKPALRAMNMSSNRARSIQGATLFNFESKRREIQLSYVNGIFFWGAHVDKISSGSLRNHSSDAGEHSSPSFVSL